MTTLSEIKDYVHERGKWQSENCYETKIERIKDTLYVTNKWKHGSRYERERAWDCILVEVGSNGKGKITGFGHDSFGINKETRQFLRDLEDEGCFDRYVIEIDCYDLAKKREVDPDGEEEETTADTGGN